MTGSARREAPYNLRMSLVDRRAFEAAAAAEECHARGVLASRSS